MKKIIHKAENRGHINHGWLDTYHSFSFAQWYNPEKMGFGALRVINDDTVAPGKGFGMHPHDNMEIITIILEGSLKHRDSMDNEGIIKENEIQAMSAGSGIMHSEFNPSDSAYCKLFQIWVLPDKLNIEPRYEQISFDPTGKENRFMTLVSPTKADNSMFINQDAWFSISKLEKNKSIEYKLKNNQHGIYIFVIEGQVKASDEILGSRDALGLSEIDNVFLEAQADSEFLVIEVPMMK